MFADLIDQSNRTRTQWAQEIGISKAYLSDLLNGNATPSLTVAVKIERLTGGAVPANSWVPDEIKQGAAA